MERDKITHERRHIRLRIEILDELLSSTKRRNYKELLETLGAALTLRGEVPIRERRLKDDISFLENELGAPIHRPSKKEPAIYYTEKFSIKKIPVDDDDVATMKKAVAILKRVANIKLTGEVDEMIAKLENKIHTNVPESNIMIGFEEHTEALGMEYFDELFSAIQEKCPVKLIYKPFNKEEKKWLVHPYMLKQYRSRWFLIGRVGSNASLSNLRLDSIHGKIKNSSDEFIENDLFDPETYFNNVIGVTIPRDQEPLEITIKVAASSAEYIRTKPIHKSQIITKQNKDGSIQIEIKLFNNYELKSTLMGYGPALQVLSPDILRAEMKKLFEAGFISYK